MESPVKPLELIVAPPAYHMVGDGFRVHNFIPSVYRLDMHRMDPFIMMDYNSKFMFPPSPQQRGVGVHPHRGFETVTLAYHGRVAHHDSAGNSGIIGEGEVQWMTAASGVLHKEYHEKSFSESGGYFQMVQLWVNLPAKDKMSAPKYQAITRADIQPIMLDEQGSRLELVAGFYKDQKGPASTFTPVHISTAYLKQNGEVNMHFPAHYTVCVVAIEGEVVVNAEDVLPQDHLGLFQNQGESFTLQAKGAAAILILAGEPIKEPIAAHGPFVMNTRAELVQAFNDFNAGLFGELAD